MSSNAALVSVIMVTYNHEKFIADAIQSVLNQTFSRFELIIVNDGSTDNTEEIIQLFNDSRITYIYQKNQGPSSASNTAILAACAKYIAIMSGDDVCYPERLETQYNFLSNSPRSQVVFSWVNFMDDNHPISVEWAEKIFNVLHGQSRAALFNHFFFRGNCLNAVTCMVEKKLLMEAGLFHLSSIQLQDYDMWVKLVKKYDFYVLPEKLIQYRIRNENMNLSSVKNTVRSVFEHYILAENMFDNVSIPFFKEAFKNDLIHKDFISDNEYELEKAFLFLKNEIPLLSAIGIKKLFHLLQDANILSMSRAQYNFDLIDLYKLMANADITNSVKLNDSQVHINNLTVQNNNLTVQNNNLTVQNNNLAAQNDNLTKTLSILHNSIAWRITKPLRFLGRKMPILLKMLRFIYRKSFSKSLPLLKPAENTSVSYEQWYREQLHNRFRLAQQGSQRFVFSADKLLGPKISIVLPVCDPELEHLKKALDSVLFQYYQNWELCIADDFSTNENVRAVLNHYASRDTRIKTLFRKERGHISATSNSALALATGDYIGLLDHDDELERDALYWIAKTIIENPAVQVIYSDEDHLDAEGKLCRPYFKPDWNKDLLLSQNYVCHFLVLNRDLFTRLNGFCSAYNGAQDYDLILRASELCDERNIKHIPLVLYHWREHAGSTAITPDAKPYAANASLRAVTDHLKRLEIDATVHSAPIIPGWNRIQYALPDHLPLISIIILSKEGDAELQHCINSIQTASYKNIELIIVDDGRAQLETLLTHMKVIKADLQLNDTQLKNMASKHATGEILLFMNPHIEVSSPAWLQEIVSNVSRKEIGVIGVSIWSPEFKLLQGGILLGLYGLAGYIHQGIEKGEPGYFGRAIIQQNVSAVTSHCMALKKDIFEKMSGFDEAFSSSLADIDLCLRIGNLGLKITWTPFAELISQSTINQLTHTELEVELFQERWENIIRHDPSYNPNLTLQLGDFSLSQNPRLEQFMRPVMMNSQ
jgi:O-antigen biosynthesis protein